MLAHRTFKSYVQKGAGALIPAYFPDYEGPWHFTGTQSMRYKRGKEVHSQQYLPGPLQSFTTSATERFGGRLVVSAPRSTDKGIISTRAHWMDSPL